VLSVYGVHRAGAQPSSSLSGHAHYAYLGMYAYMMMMMMMMMMRGGWYNDDVRGQMDTRGV